MSTLPDKIIYGTLYAIGLIIIWALIFRWKVIPPDVMWKILTEGV